MKKTAIYTAVTGGFDVLPQPQVVDGRFDYICFTDTPGTASSAGVWHFRPLAFEAGLDDRALSRKPKLLPHRYLPEYEMSLWMDANISIIDGSFYDMVLEKAAGGALFSAVEHPLRDCVYDEVLSCVRAGKASYKSARAALDYLERMNFPRHAGLFENNILLRRHNDPEVVALDELWWKCITEIAMRDQFFLVACAANSGLAIEKLLPPDIRVRDCDMLEYRFHDRKTVSCPVRELQKRWAMSRIARRINKFP